MASLRALQKALPRKDLKEILLARKGQSLPLGSVAQLPQDILGTKPYLKDGIKVTTLNKPIKPGQLYQMVDFMKTNLYSTAPVPKALGFDSTPETSREVSDFMTDELEKLLTSGVSLSFEKDGRLVAVGGNMFWARDDSYQVVEDVSMLEWNNTAAEIAEESDCAHPQLIWRQYQWQFMYNLFQSELRRLDLPFGLFFSSGSKCPSIQGEKSINTEFILPLQEKVIRSGGLTCAYSSHNYVTKVMQAMLHKSYVADGAAYEDLNLRINGKNVFDSLHKMGGVKMIMGIP